MAGAGDSEREALRAEWVGRIPPWYSPALHVATTTALGIVFAALALAPVHVVRPVELLIVPLTWVVANATEWRAHRDLLHKRVPWAATIYVQHTLQHHRLYLTHDMEIRSPKELRLVLIPSYGVVLLLLAVLPIAAALWFAGQRNLAGLFVATTQAYVVSYEWLHLSYHLPRGSRVGRSPLVRRLARHHAIHHHPSRMNQWNLNVTVPLWDWVRGTLYRGEDLPQLFADAAKEPVTDR